MEDLRPEMGEVRGSNTKQKRKFPLALCTGWFLATFLLQFLQPLCMENYSARFSTLLFLEELKREEDIRQFDMFGVSRSFAATTEYSCLETHCKP